VTGEAAPAEEAVPRLRHDRCRARGTTGGLARRGALVGDYLTAAMISLRLARSAAVMPAGRMTAFHPSTYSAEYL
jgi:hypothetical protein